MLGSFIVKARWEIGCCQVPWEPAKCTHDLILQPRMRITQFPVQTVTPTLI